MTDTVTTSIIGIQASIAVTPAAASTFVAAGFPTPATAGMATTITITARDAFGNNCQRVCGTVRFTSSDSQAVLPADYTFVVADNGVHSFSVTLKTAATQSLTVTDTAILPLLCARRYCGKPRRRSLPSTSPGFRLRPRRCVANSLTVSARDAFGNTVTSYRGTMHFSSTDLQAPLLPADCTFVAADNGIHTFSTAASKKRQRLIR